MIDEVYEEHVRCTVGSVLHTPEYKNSPGIRSISYDRFIQTVSTVWKRLQIVCQVRCVYKYTATIPNIAPLSPSAVS